MTLMNRRTALRGIASISALGGATAALAYGSSQVPATASVAPASAAPHRPSCWPLNRLINAYLAAHGLHEADTVRMNAAPHAGAHDPVWVAVRSSYRAMIEARRQVLAYVPRHGAEEQRKAGFLLYEVPDMAGDLPQYDMPVLLRSMLRGRS